MTVPSTQRHPRGRVLAFLASLRPRQWVKNVLVLAAPVFGTELDDPTVVLHTAIAFGAFCLTASGIYLVNDARDVLLDRAHPVKRYRPVAAGELPVRSAYIGGAVLIVAGLALAATSGAALTAVVASYVVLTLLYVLWFKAEPVLDIAMVAAGFLLRAVAGGAAGGIYLSEWFLLAATFGSLFMASGKRYAELQMVPESATTRPSMARYSDTYLRFVWTVSASLLVMTYGLWAFELRAERDTLLPALSLAPFILAVMRYAVDVDAGTASEPEEIALRDRVLQALALIWLALVVAAVYF